MTSNIKCSAYWFNLIRIEEISAASIYERYIYVNIVNIIANIKCIDT